MLENGPCLDELVALSRNGVDGLLMRTARFQISTFSSKLYVAKLLELGIYKVECHHSNGQNRNELDQSSTGHRSSI